MAHFSDAPAAKSGDPIPQKIMDTGGIKDPYDVPRVTTAYPTKEPESETTKNEPMFIDPRTGNIYHGGMGGVFDSRTGEFLPGGGGVYSHPRGGFVYR